MRKRIEQYIEEWISHGYSEGIPDDAPARLVQLGKVPCYRTIAIAILKNDQTLQSLGFSPPKSYWYSELKRIEIEKRERDREKQPAAQGIARMIELYRKHRPRKLSDVLGQDGIVAALEGMLGRNAVPHALLFSGSSGCGKTSIARALCRRMGCETDGRKKTGDFCEVNCAEARGIDTIREIQQRAGSAAMGKCRVWLLDEAHRLTPDAQSGLLKTLEDTPAHVWFMLATTDPNKLLKTIHTRCTHFKVAPLPPKLIRKLLDDVAEKEGWEPLSDEVADKIIEVAEGSARKALVLLQQIADLEGDDAKLDAVSRSDTGRQAIEICRLLLGGRAKWNEVASILKEIEDEPESVRRMVLGYANKVLLGGGKQADRAYQVIVAFEQAFYDGGAAALTRACWEVLGQR